MAKPASTDTRHATTADDLACAAELMEVMPMVMGAMRAAMRQQVGGGMTVPQFRCLNFIGRHPDCSVSALAAFMGTTLATASTNADRLVRAGLVNAQASQVDRRRSEMRATPEGAALLGGMRKRARQDMAATLSGLLPDDIAVVRQGLAVLKKSFATGHGRHGTNAAH